MAENNKASEGKGNAYLLETMLSGLDGFLDSKTVVGEPVNAGGATLIPLIEVNIGMGSGGFEKKENCSAGAMSVKASPVAILVIQNENIRLINVKNQDTLSRMAEMVPGLIDKLTGGKRISDEAMDASLKMAEELKD